MTVEAKLATNGLPKSFWETYSSFNTFGGTVYLGVGEDSEGYLVHKGVENVDGIVKDLWATINNVQKVSSNLLRSDDVMVEEVG